MKIFIDDARIKELIKYILKNNFDLNNSDDIKNIEKEIMKRFDEKDVIAFLYSYINDLLKDIIKGNN
ncbi:hypothetical protein [Ilyobacter polytropus]|uniref:Uncharacterized protein n=1 Tax=Ilyobacter polytropus (strain ATCC 51220 / DSM 2926 / LMG 16218 / CuHBu1) TaxID=572544 RepID=E3HCS0_ILYPC|nr:hypothetical protein [Ilyobacter polytropus]ADO84465.1 hypothetical protein Ilyop_2710 [Ilyobacter polytropus DSM 2926]